MTKFLLFVPYLFVPISSQQFYQNTEKFLGQLVFWLNLFQKI